MSRFQGDRETSCPACNAQARPLRALYTACGVIFFTTGGLTLLIGLIAGIQLIQGDLNCFLAAAFLLLSGGTVVYAGYGFLRSRDKTYRCTACGRLFLMAPRRTGSRQRWWM